LEESLLEFRGSLVLVTHDRYMLDRVSNVVLGLDGQGSAESFADYSQWEAWQGERASQSKPTNRAIGPLATSTDSSGPVKKKLSYLEAREYAGIEHRIAEAEQLLQNRRAELEDPAIVSDAPKLVAAHTALEIAQKNLDELYARWTELEEKTASAPNPQAH
jgi:ATP-binding cassette subfamily F protein uup